MKFDITINVGVEIPDCKIDTLTGIFRKALPSVLGQFISSVLNVFATFWMANGDWPFGCSECGSREFFWKTRNAKPTRIKTIYGEIELGQFQVQCRGCGKKMFITRKLLGIGPYHRMSGITRRMLGILGSLTTFRVSEKIFRMFGIMLDRMSVWRCVQAVGREIEFDLDPDEYARGQADGTGIPVREAGKRGRELKVFVQNKTGGGVRIAGLAIGPYHGGWDRLFRPLKASIRKFGRFLLVTDGDTEILKGIRGIRFLFQRCLWHIPHQLKHCLWRDGVSRESGRWKKIMGKIFHIVAIPKLLPEEDVESVLDVKRKSLEQLLDFCRFHGCRNSLAYLENAAEDMFTSFSKRLKGKTTSHAERVMRTVNMRINVGKWSEEGALNVTKVRLAHYYNGFEIPGTEEERDNVMTQPG